MAVIRFVLRLGEDGVMDCLAWTMDVAAIASQTRIMPGFEFEWGPGSAAYAEYLTSRAPALRERIFQNWG